MLWNVVSVGLGDKDHDQILMLSKSGLLRDDLL